MFTSTFYSLREIQRRDLGMVLQWRNNEAVRKFSYNDHEISPEEHEAWFNRLQNDKNRKVLIFEFENQPAGVIQFFDINPVRRTCKWGFYLGSDVLPKGVGKAMGKLALSYAFQHLGVETVYGEALATNERSTNYHAKIGFTEDGRYLDHVFRDGRWVDVILYSISLDDFFHTDEVTWPTAREWN